MKQEEDFGGSTKSERSGLGNKIQGEAGVGGSLEKREADGWNRKRGGQ